MTFSPGRPSINVTTVGLIVLAFAIGFGLRMVVAPGLGTSPAGYVPPTLEKCQRETMDLLKSSKPDIAVLQSVSDFCYSQVSRR